MIAKRLEGFLAEAIWKTDFAGRSPAEMVQRFQKLRGSGLLPRGRGKNAQRLANKEIAAGILSLITAKPGFAGLGSTVLMGLKPVGGEEASFAGAETFGKAIETILEDVAVLDSVLEVRASDSEIFTNANCRASIVYRSGTTERTANYVAQTATSLLQAGAERTYDPRNSISTVITETIFLAAFFRRLQREIQRELDWPEAQLAVDDDDEDDEETAKQRRAERLGLVPGSRFLNLGVASQVTWPSRETLIDFENYKLVLMPRTRERAASIHIDLYRNGLSLEDASSLINRLLSLLTWCDDQFGFVQGGWSGNSVPVAVPNENFGFSPTEHWLFNRKIPPSAEARRAVAIYREGKNAEQSHLISYAVLAYYKIIEIRYRGRGETKTWFRDNYPKLSRIPYMTDALARFETACRTEKPHDYIYRACRSAVAHANKPYSSDPDDSAELRRLHSAAEILRELARVFIRDELGLSDCAGDGT